MEKQLNVRIFLTSDQHFFHYNIIIHCKRPFKDEYHMNEVLVQHWNSVVTKDDVVFHLGDLSAGLKGRQHLLKELIESLNGEIHFITGNHDYETEQFYLSCGIKSVSAFKIIHSALLLHYPIFIDYYDKKSKKRGKLFEKLYMEAECEYIIHGHSHETPSKDINRYNVSVDINNWTPVLVDDIFKHYFKAGESQWAVIQEQLTEKQER